MPVVRCVSPFLSMLSKDLSDSIVVVFDVFRASTTAVIALYRGFKYVIPVYDVSVGLVLARKLGAIVAGESHGVKIPGYDFSNSPYQFLYNVSPRKYLVLRSSNGTKAILSFGKNNIVLVGSIVNARFVASAIHKLLEEHDRDVYLVAVGRVKEGREKHVFEDKIGVGHVADYLSKLGLNLDRGCYSFVRMAYKFSPIREFLSSKLFKYFIFGLGCPFLKDMFVVAQLDSVPVVPILEKKNNLWVLKKFDFSD